jgi:choline kinase
MFIASGRNAEVEVLVKNTILLAAGGGSRLAPLTDYCHKSLLPVAGRSALQRIIDTLMTAGVQDIVVVTGHRHADIENFLAGYGERVRCVHNEHYKQDTNILSVETGVGALHDPQAGYLIVETDLVIEPAGWEKILSIDNATASFWVTRGHYSSELTGGALHADSDGRVQSIVYQPQYEATYEGWQKLLGILYVGSGSVQVDRELRQAAIQSSVAQYYMMPWVRHLDRLPCRALDLGQLFAASYNDPDTYRRIDAGYAELARRKGFADVN